MATLLQEVKRWATEELDLPAHRLPYDSYMKTLCVGTGASIWKYVVQHIYHERNVRVMRGNLQWYTILQDKELKQVNRQNKDSQRLELQKQITDLQAELNHIDYKISAAEEQLSNEEQSVNRQCTLYDESKLRELMLDSFRLSCMEERDALARYTQAISIQHHNLEELSKRAEVKLVFSTSDKGDTGVAAEPLVLRDVRELCNDRVLFFQSLQENALNACSSTEFSPEQRNAAYQHWLSAAEVVLRSHPPNQVLLALQTLASKEQAMLEEKTSAVDVERDVSALGFRYESNHLLDVSVNEEEDLPPVRGLLQSAWQDVEQCYMQLAEMRSRARQLQTDLGALIKEVQLRSVGQDEHADPTARSVFELELQTVKQAAVRDSVREQCTRLQLQNRQKREALRSLHEQCQSIMDFRQLVDFRQEQIRSLIKGNSTIKTELPRVHSELKQFVQEKLSKQFGSVIKAANGLRNSVSQEAKLFNSVSLALLDRRIIDGERVPVDQLSLYRVNSPALQAIRQSLCTPTYMAAEELSSQAAFQNLQLRFLRRLLQLHRDSLEDIQRRTALLPAPNQQVLLERMKSEDAELFQTLLPRVHELTQKCSKALTYADQVSIAITHWWEQPGQFALPELQQDGLTFQQWLQRWKLATKMI